MQFTMSLAMTGRAGSRHACLIGLMNSGCVTHLEEDVRQLAEERLKPRVSISYDY